MSSPTLGEEKGGTEDLWEDRLSCAGGGARHRRRERDRGFFSLGFIKWNLKGNIEPEGGFLITSL